MAAADRTLSSPVAEAGVHAPSDGLVARAAVAAGIAIVVLVIFIGVSASIRIRRGR